MAKKKGGSGAKTSAKQEAKELKKKKQEEKANKAAKKKSGKDARDAGEDDIEAILAEILRKEEQKTAVTVTACDGPPSPRANFTVTTLPTGDMVLFGGEHFDGQDTRCFNDLFRWNVEKNEWRQIESPNTPPPRCSHQAAFFRDHLYVLGGEFATTEQFYHYKDLWRLDIKTNAWEKLEMNGKPPSARSGHRMVVWRNQLVLFGGFYEAFRETKWFNDLYLMSFQDLRWRRIEFPATATLPAPRSGHQMAAHGAGDQIFLYGGWSKEKEAGQKREGKVHNDMWVLNMKPCITGGNPTWERLGKKGAPPSIRSGAAMTVHKNRALLFGGVLDHEGPQHAVRSVFYNDLFAFDMDRRRWYHLLLKKKKAREKGPKKRKGEDSRVSNPVGEGDAEEDAGEDGGEEDYIDSEDELEVEKAPHENAFVYIDESGKLVYVEPDELQEAEEAAGEEVKEKEKEGGEEKKETKEEEKEKEEGNEVEEEKGLSSGSTAGKEVQDALGEEATGRDANGVGESKDSEEEASPCPLPRINPCLTVRGNTLYVYGGLLEVGDREYALDDCWSLELNTRVAWTLVQAGTMEEQVWKGEEEESEMGSEFAEDEEDGSQSDADGDSDNEEHGDEDDEQERGRASAGMSCVALEEVKEDTAGGARATKDAEKAATRKSSKAKGGKRGGAGGIREEIRQLQEKLGVDDPNRTPQAGEVMRDFFERTKLFWTEEVMRRRAQQAEAGEEVERLTEKELRRDAFSLAGERYAELEPSLARLNALEAEQREFEAKEAEKRKGQKGAGPRGSRRS